jgi:transposase
MLMSESPRPVPDELWERLDPLFPHRQRRFRYPGRRPLDDRAVLNGILLVLQTGIAWEHLPQEHGFGSGMTCWRRLRLWQDTGVWERLQWLLASELDSAEEIDWSRAIRDSGRREAASGAERRARVLTERLVRAPGTTS